MNARTAGVPVALPAHADVVICNGVESELLAGSDYAVMVGHAPNMLRGLHRVAKQLGARRVMLAVSKRYGRAIAELQLFLRDYSGITLHPVADFYPASNPDILRHELGVSDDAFLLRPRELWALDAAMEGRALTHHVVTVAGAVAEPRAVLAPNGVNLGTLVRAAGGPTVQRPVYFVGGLLRGGFTDNPHQCVGKQTAQVTVLSATHSLAQRRAWSDDDQLARLESACDGCGACTDICPIRAIGKPLFPDRLARHLAHKTFPPWQWLAGAQHCIECGLCEHVACPANLSPPAAIRNITRVSEWKTLKPLSPTRSWMVGSRVKRVDVLRRLRLDNYDADFGHAPVPVEAQTLRVPLAGAMATVLPGSVVSAGMQIGLPRGPSPAVHAPAAGEVAATSMFEILLDCRR